MKNSSDIKEIWKVTAIIQELELCSDTRSLSVDDWKVRKIRNRDRNSDETQIEGKFPFSYPSEGAYFESLSQFQIFLGCLLANVYGVELADVWHLSDQKTMFVNFSGTDSRKLRPPIIVDFKYSAPLILTEETFPKIVKHYQEIMNLKKLEALALQRILYFFSKAQFENATQNRFIWNWIALNVAFNHEIHNGTYQEWKGTGDTPKIRKFANWGFKKQDVEWLIDYFSSHKTKISKHVDPLRSSLFNAGYNCVTDLLVGLNLITPENEEGKSVNRSQELKEAIENGNEKRDLLRKILLCFFQIRSELLHASQPWGTFQGEKILDPCTRALGMILRKHIGYLARRTSKLL